MIHKTSSEFTYRLLCDLGIPIRFEREQFQSDSVRARPVHPEVGVTTSHGTW